MFQGSTHLEVLILHEKDLPYIGVHTAYMVLICCDKQVLDAEACEANQLGYTALSSAVPSMPGIYYDLLWLENGALSVSLQHRYEVIKTGLHYVMFVNCHEEGTPAMALSGTVTWINPDGYLAGSEAKLIPFYLALGGVYSLFLSLWILYCAWKKDLIIILHYAIAVVLVLGTATAFANASMLSAANESGYVCTSCAVTWASLSTLHALSLRVLALVVAMGLAVAIPWWDVEPRQRWGVLILCLAYLVAEGAQNFAIAVNPIADSSGRAPVLFMLPVNLANTAFLIAIFVELIRTIHMMRDDGEREKFRMYMIHLLFLFGVAAAALFFYIVQLLVQWRDVRDLTWHFDWIFEASWETSMLLIVVILCIMWYPRPLIKSFAYQEQEPLDWRPPRLVD